MNRDDHFCQGGFTSLMREASANPSRLNNTAAKRAYRKPVTTPSKAAFDPMPAAAGGSKGPTIGKRTAKPKGKTIRKNVLKIDRDYERDSSNRRGEDKRKRVRREYGFALEERWGYQR